jgi:hypothetical protein
MAAQYRSCPTPAWIPGLLQCRAPVIHCDLRCVIPREVLGAPLALVLGFSIGLVDGELDGCGTLSSVVRREKRYGVPRGTNDFLVGGQIA